MVMVDIDPLEMNIISSLHLNYVANLVGDADAAKRSDSFLKACNEESELQKLAVKLLKVCQENAV